MLGRLAFLDQAGWVGDNLILNAIFRGNCRELSGSIVLAAGARGHDGWKAGAGGCSYSVTAGVATITAGTLIYTVDGQAITSGPYTLSHAGTAPARIDAGPYFAGTQTALEVRGTPTALEFGVGTIVDPKFEAGNAATPFAVLYPALERARLDYYVQAVQAVTGGNTSGEAWASAVGWTLAHRSADVRPMRAVPSLAFLNNTGVETWSYSGSWTATTVWGSVAGAAHRLRLLLNATAAGDGRGMLVRKSSAGDVVAVLSAEF